VTLAPWGWGVSAATLPTYVRLDKRRDGITRIM
jgi:hypothetical protein